MTYVSPYPEFCSGCFAKFELSVVKWHESRHFSFVFCSSLLFFLMTNRVSVYRHEWSCVKLVNEIPISNFAILLLCCSPC